MYDVLIVTIYRPSSACTPSIPLAATLHVTPTARISRLTPTECLSRPPTPFLRKAAIYLSKCVYRLHEPQRSHRISSQSPTPLLGNNYHTSAACPANAQTYEAELSLRSFPYTFMDNRRTKPSRNTNALALATCHSPHSQTPAVVPQSTSLLLACFRKVSQLLLYFTTRSQSKLIYSRLHPHLHHC